MKSRFLREMSRFYLLAFLLPVRLAQGGAWQPQAVPTPQFANSEQPLYFRCFIRVPDNMTVRGGVDLWSDSALFSFGDIPGPFTILLNGQKIGSGDLLAAEPRRRFKIPRGILERGAFNVLAVRLSGAASEAGLRVAPILHGYHDELLLAGTWQAHAGEAASADLLAKATSPPITPFTEAHFREASTALAANAELVRGARLTPAESLRRMQVADDLAIDLLLHEPRVAQPTHFSFDARGRLWVAQYRQYPYPAGLKMVSRDKYYRGTFDRVPPPPPRHTQGRDIISVHEDLDGDGHYDRHTEVLTGLNMANAVVHGQGGIWVMHTPYLLFYPDANGDDVPDADPEVRLAGFGLEDTHSVANGLAWGPDGWLYGAQGSTTTSHVRRPGIDPPGSPGVYHESCMVWRYHPRTKDYEIFAEGGGNNFGLEFDSAGRLYSGHNGGDTRGWHFVQHGVYLKQGKDPGKFGPPTNPYAFGEMPMMRTTNRITRFSHHFTVADGTAVPAPWRGQLLSVDPLHRQVVASARAGDGSTFLTIDTGVLLQGKDPAFRPVFTANAPDGSVFVADFYEEYIAHGQNYQGQIDPDSGRIYRLRGRNLNLERSIDLSRKSGVELIELLGHSNRWHRQTAVRLLGERREAALKPRLIALLGGAGSVPAIGTAPGSENPQTSRAHGRSWPALEALWVLHQCQWLDEATADEALRHPSAPVGSWAIRLMGDSKRLPGKFAASLLNATAHEPDAEVRCQMASTARRLPLDQALPLVAGLVRRDADADDPFILQLCWLVMEQFCGTQPEQVLGILGVSAPPSETINSEAGTRVQLSSQTLAPWVWSGTPSSRFILQRLMKRFALPGKREDLVRCARLLESAPNGAQRENLLTAFEEAFKGRTLPLLPERLVRALVASGHASRGLRMRLGDRAAIQEAVGMIDKSGADRIERAALIRVLGEVRELGAVRSLLGIVAQDSNPELRRAALAALSHFDDPAIGLQVAAKYKELPAALRPAAGGLLASRSAWSRAFLSEIEAGRIEASSVDAGVAVRLREHPDKSIAEIAVKALPSSLPDVPLNRAPEVLKRAEEITGILRDGSGDPYSGESIFLERCAACHQLFHKGGRAGPDLTSYQRDDLGTLLPSLLDPSAEIREGFVNYLATMKDGRSLSGFVVDQDPAVLVLRALDGEDFTLARSEIQELAAANRSLMPEGLLDGLSAQQLRDFFAYLRIPQPIRR